MPRTQAIVVRDNRVLMVKHRMDGDEWWCLPGGGLEPGETPAAGAQRELREECNVDGTVIRQTAHIWFAPDDEAYTFLVDIGEQTPSCGHDPEFAPGDQVLVDVQWLRLCEMTERDRAFLWSGGLLGVAEFLNEVAQWRDVVSYPIRDGL